MRDAETELVRASQVQRHREESRERIRARGDRLQVKEAKKDWESGRDSPAPPLSLVTREPLHLGTWGCNPDLEEMLCDLAQATLPL